MVIFNKYWPIHTFNINIETINEESLFFNSIFEREKYIYNLLTTTKIDPNHFTTCSIITFAIQINYSKNDEEELKENIDLYKIFNYLINNSSYENPFVKYRDPEFTNPISVVYKDMVVGKQIQLEKLLEWVGIKKKKDENGKMISYIKNTTRGLQFKRYFGNITGTPIWSTIEIHQKNTYKNTRMILRTSFKEIDNASMKDVADVVANCKML